jgi:thymidylate kinase
MPPRIISIEGNIGAGKTTLLEKLVERSSRTDASQRWIFMREPVDQWATIKDRVTSETILSKFYADPAKYAFPFQVMAYATRLAELRRIVREHPECEVIVCERSLDADRHIFANMLADEGKIEDICYQIYHRFFEESAHEFALNGIIYVDADAQVCFDRIRGRDREGESNIPLVYLETCRQYHENWLMELTDCDLLHLRTNQRANYDSTDPADPGNLWLEQMELFIKSLIEK